MDIGSLYTESINFLIKYSLQKAYLDCFLSNADVIACQNDRMKKAIDSRYSHTNIVVMPFYRLCPKQAKARKNKYDLCYVSLAHPHKNHKLLFDALEILGKVVNQ
jgi:glycosyltransferase involved in cell wall biosynthesis